MAVAPTNMSYDGSPVQFRLDSPLLAGLDPLALDILGDLRRVGASMDVPVLLDRADANHPALACFAIPDFQPGVYALDPRDIKKFGDEDEKSDYGEEEAKQQSAGNLRSYPFAAVDSRALVFADVRQLPSLVRLLTWEQCDLSLQAQGDAVIGKIVEALGGPYPGLFTT